MFIEFSVSQIFLNFGLKRKSHFIHFHKTNTHLLFIISANQLFDFDHNYYLFSPSFESECDASSDDGIDANAAEIGE
jgi:hypothetical protein